jgi:8-oxo-dGTP pyrophosphatase MutT (NUDIX family)
VTERLFVPRTGARVLLVDDAGRTLLFRGTDPGRPGERWWVTPGGGVEPDETSADGACRELAEETGLRVSPAELGTPVWRETTEFPFDGVWYRQEQDFFLLRVTAWAVDTTGFSHIERATVDRHHWWTVEELEGTAERYYPVNLPALLRRVLAEAGDRPMMAP